jgi:pimeloyl-ACP methyl ester carboxylesterase
MQLSHDIAGTGPVLVLVHGVVHRRQAWNAVLDLLTPYRTVVTVDLPGHGATEQLAHSDAGISTALLDELEAFVDSMTPAGSRAHIAGNSLGGYLALALAARGVVASATALSPAGFWNSPTDQARSMLTFRSLRLLARGLGRHAPAAMRYRVIRYPALSAFFAHPSRVSYESAVVDTASLTTNALLDTDLTDQFVFPPLAQPLVPVTVAWGSRDLVLPQYQRHNVSDVFPHARIIKVPGVGHVPMTDNPELIASILLAGSESAPR